MSVSKDVAKKISLIKVTDERLQCAKCSYLAVGPLQLKCGDRICTSCARILKQQGYGRSAAIDSLYFNLTTIHAYLLYSAVTFDCQKCQETVSFVDVSWIYS